MAIRITRGNALIGRSIIKEGELKYGNRGHKVPQIATADITRSDTSAIDLFTIPANADIRYIGIFGVEQADAGTSADISVGISGGSGTHFVATFDVNSAQGAGQQVPAADNLGDVGTSEITVNGVYAEAGAASTQGGPWTVIMQYTVPSVLD